MDSLPRLLRSFRRPPGVIKLDYEDFEVEEIPLYPFAGDGTHTYFLLEKRGLNTMQAIYDIAAALDLPRAAFGYAGIKDARAVTRQWLSIEHVPPERLAGFKMARLEVRQVTRHRNKLKLGHLRGNRFRIRVRQTQPERIDEIKTALAELSRRGVPNYFGPQRFGTRGDNAAIGRALLQGRIDDALDLVLGKPGNRDFGEIWHARKLYDEGKFDTARNKWPGMFRDQRRALAVLADTGNRKRALLSIDKHSRLFYLSAYQSELFNRIVEARLTAGGGLESLESGDLAWRHQNGAVFRVEDVAKEQPRADALEISASGPLYGTRMTECSGAPGEREAAVLREEGLKLADFSSGPLRASGGRRPLRFPLENAKAELGADERGAYLALQFELPRGCYATTVIRELFAETEGGSSGADSAEFD